MFAKIDYQAENYRLSYLRTKEQKEVDFALVKDGAIENLIEVKYANHRLESGVVYFHNKYQLPSVQVVKDLKREQVQDGIQIVSGSNFLKNLFL